MGFVLGAVVAPTDAIAATSIAKRMGLPKRIVDILEGESLVNDASGLLALEFGVAMLVRGETATISAGLVRLVYLTAAGIAIGLLIGVVVNWVEKRIDHGPIEIALSLMVPYVAYLAADSVRASGVLAVVACGLYLSRKSSTFFSQRPTAGVGGLGFVDLHPERAGLCTDRAAIAHRDTSRNSRLQSAATAALRRRSSARF